ncbi:Phospholipase A(1) DAD1, chloroplastic [Glycine soja]|nr:Phospholipase A(1) DAD1, chloroplastic [Glycine soja]
MEKMMNMPQLQSSSLSSSPPLSKKVGKRWKEYQGMNNWDGLLDPLDENLRAEILRYGHFVEAAYKSFEFDPSSPNYATCKFQKNTLFEQCGLRNTGYKVTKHLRATSGIKLPSWVATQSSYVGNGNVFRMAPLTHVSVPSVATGITADPCSMDGNGAMVESGFLSLYTSAGSSKQSFTSLQDMVRKEIGRILKTYEGENLSLTITGHSLGAALATLTAYDIKNSFIRQPPETVMRSTGWEPKLPAAAGGNWDQAVAHSAHVVQRWIRKRAEEVQWLLYSEVGKELRLCSRDSPYLRGVNIATCHDLNTYLHLVDGFVSSTCPFRATAKRFLQH